MLDKAEVRARARYVAREYVARRAAKTDATGEFDWEVVKVMREEGLLALPFESEHGGTSTGPAALLLAIAELAKVCATTALTLSMQQLGSLPIKLAGTVEQKRRWLPPLAAGEWLPAYALSERQAGSDPSALTTSASRDGRNYVLNGVKCFISNAGVASLYTIFARTTGTTGTHGISAFVVEQGTAGFAAGNLERKMGLRGQPTGDLILDDCRVPATNRLGAEGDGFRLAMRVLDRSRPGIAAQSVGIAEGATDYALEYAKRRRTFGRPLIEHQLVAGLLAGMEARCAAARALLEQCGTILDRDDAGHELTKMASMTKLFCSDAAMDITTSAVQILGGNGYVQDYPVERMMRDAKVTQIYEGTNEIQRLVIARRMAAEPREPSLPLPLGAFGGMGTRSLSGHAAEGPA